MNCSYCKSTIPEDNFEIHEATCKKNTAFCPNCSLMLPKSKLEEHMKENHELKICENCGGSYEVKDFLSHPCSNPSMVCEYCEAVLPFLQLNEHKLTCENRTSVCPYCGKYIKNKDFKTHIALGTCTQEPSSLPMLPPSIPQVPPIFPPNYIPGENPNFLSALFNQDAPPPNIFKNYFDSKQWPYSYQEPDIFKKGSSSSVSSVSDRYQSDSEQVPANAKPMNVLFTINKRRGAQIKIKTQPRLFFYEYEDYHKWLQKQFE